MAQAEATRLDALQGSMRGELIQPDHFEYEAARRVYNGMIDKHPVAIARCAGVADVISAVNFARENQMLIAVRGGGHSVPGKGTCDDGLVIDLSHMKSIRVDPTRQTARVEPGATWNDFDHAGHAFGLATPGGQISTTGVAGLTLGGGFGHLTRKYGLTCDNLLSADVVTADGRFLTASEEENSDLFWALRGGGGNFGVVTSFEFRMHPVNMVYGGPICYSIEQADVVLRFYREFIQYAPEDMNAFFLFFTGPAAPFIPEALQGATMCALMTCHLGTSEQAERDIQKLREFVPPILDLAGPIPYPALNSMFDALYPAGLHHYWKADFVTELTDDAISAHVEHGPRLDTCDSLSTMHLYPLVGAQQKVGIHDTAFGYRDADFVHVIVAVGSGPDEMPHQIDWVRSYWDALHPQSAEGGYVNFLMDEGDQRVSESYRDNYPRLREIKRKYDPDNLFRVNQNIKP
jgi:FAD/FMN-containing dehydrogenase